MRSDELVTDHGVGDLTWGMRPGHVGVAIVDARDPPSENLLERQTGALGFG